MGRCRVSGATRTTAPWRVASPAPCATRTFPASDGAIKPSSCAPTPRFPCSKNGCNGPRSRSALAVAVCCVSPRPARSFAASSGHRSPSRRRSPIYPRRSTTTIPPLTRRRPTRPTRAARSSTPSCGWPTNTCRSTRRPPARPSPRGCRPQPVVTMSMTKPTPSTLPPSTPPKASSGPSCTSPDSSRASYRFRLPARATRRPKNSASSTWR